MSLPSVKETFHCVTEKTKKKPLTGFLPKKKTIGISWNGSVYVPPSFLLPSASLGIPKKKSIICQQPAATSRGNLKWTLLSSLFP